MTQFGGSFRFVQLPAVTQLLAELGSTGRLGVSSAELNGEIWVRAGQIVGVRLAGEYGRPALEAIAVALHDAEFAFTDEPVADSAEVLVTADERAGYLDRLSAMQRRLAEFIPSLGLVPRLVDAPHGNMADARITIGAAALQLIPALVHGHTLEQVAEDRGLVRTLRAVADLIEGGLVKLDPKPDVATEPKLAVAPAEPLIETPVAAPPEPIQLATARQRAIMPPGVAARLATAHNFSARTPDALRAAKPARFAGVRKAIASFFLNDEEAADLPSPELLRSQARAFGTGG